MFQTTAQFLSSRSSTLHSNLMSSGRLSLVTHLQLNSLYVPGPISPVLYSSLNISYSDLLQIYVSVLVSLPQLLSPPPSLDLDFGEFKHFCYLVTALCLTYSRCSINAQ